jgi:hypothetical protein
VVEGENGRGEKIIQDKRQKAKDKSKVKRRKWERGC